MEHLLQDAQNGDQFAIAQIVEHYEKMINSYLERLVDTIGHRDYHLLADKRQQCRLRVLKCIQRYRPSGNWEAYVSYSLKQTVFLERASPLKTESLDTVPCISISRDSLHDLEIREEVTYLKSKLNRLKPQHRTYIILKFGLEDQIHKTQTETAQLMGLTHQRINTIHHEALDHLRRLCHVDAVRLRRSKTSHASHLAR